MSHVRNPILFTAIVACFVLLYGAFAAPPILAQDAPEDSINQAETAPTETVTGDQPEDQPESQPAAVTEEPQGGDEVPTTPAGDDTTAAMTEDTTAAATDEPPSSPREAVSPTEDTLIRLEDVLTGEQPPAEGDIGADTMMAADTAVTTAPEPEAQMVEDETSYTDVTFAPGEKPRVTIETNMGTFTIELWPDVAPNHCKSFVYLAEKGFYDSLLFYRVVPGYLIQGGCPFNNGTGGPGYTLAPEFSNKPHEDGTVSASRLEDDLNSAGSQFFICLGRAMSLDGKYTVFGKVVDGIDIVHQIEGVPTQAERPTSPVRMLSVQVQREEADTGPAPGTATVPEAATDTTQGTEHER
jgi:peptidyl-prolyl cis-trans isomerase B (cyclophilin B)